MPLFARTCLRGRTRRPLYASPPHPVATLDVCAVLRAGWGRVCVQLVPTLRVLYDTMATKAAAHTFVYLLLILFLILTEDAGFNERLQTIVRGGRAVCRATAPR